jgi:hypothetical protein
LLKDKGLIFLLTDEEEDKSDDVINKQNTGGSLVGKKRQATDSVN